MTTISNPIDDYGMLSYVAMGALADPIYPPNIGTLSLGIAFDVSSRGGASAVGAIASTIEGRGGASGTSEFAFELYSFGGQKDTGRLNAILNTPFAVSTRGAGRSSNITGPFTISARATVVNLGRLSAELGVAGDTGYRDLRFVLTAGGGIGNVGTMAAAIRNAFRIETRGGGRVDGSLPAFSLEADSSSGMVGGLVGSIRFALEASGTKWNLGQAALQIPLFELIYGATLSVEIPSFVLSASGGPIDVAADGYAYAINIATGDVTRYTNFAFDYLLRFEGETIGVTSEGLFLLGGDTDAFVGDGAPLPINAVAELAPSDFGASNLKRLAYVYLGVKSGSAMNVTATTDSATSVTAMTATIGRNRRAKLARGAKSRFWRVKIENRNGEDFAIDAVEMLPMQLGRKV